ncbi:MAG: sulfatase-like hydrolase/transferase [Lentisphaerae bacterium]|nr:sulfatase-like hydrolase/transferase [Lentisphaerota bacterium]
MSDTKPNILVLMTDQQRPDSLGAYGCSVAKTPNIDALARDGAVFDNCYVQNPLCCPSRYSFLTGRYPHCHRVRANWFAPRDGERSFGHHLGRTGYRTALIGKMHFTPWYDNFGFDGRVIAESKFAFDCPDDYQAFLARHGWSRGRLYDVHSETYINQATAVVSKLPAALHIDSFVGRSLCEYLRRTDGPFCVFASFPSPHNPYDPPKEYLDLFNGVAMPPRNMTEGEADRKPREAYNYINRRLGWPCATDQLTEEQVQTTKRHYYATCTLVDDWVGRIVDTLKQRGLYENTIIVYTSDHGDLLGDHGLVYKQCFYEQSVRVPLIVHAPARFAARRSTELVELIDLFPTFCELGGADAGVAQQGRSLVPVLDGTAPGPHRDAAFSENYFGCMIRRGDYKMVYYYGRPYGELYNLAEDPDEQNNVWDDLRDSEVARGLRDRLLAWSFDSRDTQPPPVRRDHQDPSPPLLRLVDGRTAEAARQPWELDLMKDLYGTWEFGE